MIKWTPEGLPVPTSVPTISKQALTQLADVALSLPYTDPLGIDKEFEGMTNAEVMMIRLARRAAGGDMAAAESLLDRVLGRPKQSVESKSLRLSYEDFIKERAAAAGREPPSDERVVDAEVIDPKKDKGDEDLSGLD